MQVWGPFKNKNIMNPSPVFLFVIFVFVFALFCFQKGVFALRSSVKEKVLKGSASRLVNPHFFTNYHESFFPVLVPFY